jgi:hypothetical protein
MLLLPQPSPPDEVPPTTQSSTQTQSPNISSQALGSQLAAALHLLHKKSEEISELQAQVDALREQSTSAKVNSGDKRAGSEQPFSTKETVHVATGVQTDQVREAQAAFDLERAQWAEEKTTLQSETDALRADKTHALTDVEFFREQYQKASAFASSTRSENEELLARATLAESQTVNGIAMIRATFEARVDRLDAEVRKYKTLSEMLTERARRTDDDVRYRAAIAPELEREYQRLLRQLEEREAELDETKDELRAEKKVKTRLRRLVARLEAEGLADGGNSHDREPPLRSSGEKDDEDYVPGTSPSSSPPIEIGSGTSPRDQQAPGPNNEEDVTMLADEDVERLAGDDNASRTNDDMVYLCWWRSGERSCDAVVTSKSVSHLLCWACDIVLILVGATRACAFSPPCLSLSTRIQSISLCGYCPNHQVTHSCLEHELKLDRHYRGLTSWLRPIHVLWCVRTFHWKSPVFVLEIGLDACGKTGHAVMELDSNMIGCLSVYSHTALISKHLSGWQKIPSAVLYRALHYSRFQIEGPPRVPLRQAELREPPSAYLPRLTEKFLKN